MVVPQGGMRRSHAIRSRGSKRRRDAVQTRVRGGCSGGGWPRPSGRESLRRSAIASEATRGGWNTIADIAVKLIDAQAAMNTHLSQPTGDGAFDGQHGMSLAIWSVVADADVSSAIACIDPPEDVSAMTGRETGASARPAITRIASSRRMAKVRFTELDFHSLAAMESLSFLHTMGSNRRY